MARITEPTVAQANSSHKVILGILAQKKALSLVELMSFVDIPDGEVSAVVHDLEHQNLVKVTGAGTLDEIIAIREQGLRAAR
jgi:DNA-binding IclR family transcriptional regulator